MSSISGVQWRLAVPPEVETEYVGTKLGDYYTRADVSAQTQVKAREVFLSLYGVDIGGVGVPVPAYVGVAALGAQLVLPEDHPPMVGNQGRVLPDRESVLALRPAVPEASEWMQRYLAMREEMGRELGKLPPLGAGQEGPITSAVLLRGDKFFLDVLDEPEVAHHLLGVVTQTFINFVRYTRRINGQPEAGNTGIADDMAGMLPPSLWPEFVLPYWLRIYEELGPGRRSTHTELLRPGHLPFLRELKIDAYDPGNDQYLEVEDVVGLTDHMDVSWNLYTVRDMLDGTPETIRATYTRSVQAGMRHMMTELCRRIPRSNVEAFVEVARQHE
ncbi:MAG: uroporphyrinogen decarboxylase family protein [Anaerolineae bacterium]|jgi:uroporphyrinogen-III decarboxylase